MNTQKMPQAVRTFLAIALALTVLAALFAITSTDAKAAPVQTGIIKETPGKEGGGGDTSKCGSSVPFTLAKGGVLPKNPCADDGITKKEAETYKVTIRCSGASGLGSLKKGGWYGAAVAGAGCVWGHVWS